MRINKYIASNFGVSRRKADDLIEAGKVTVNGNRPSPGTQISESDKVEVKGLKQSSGPKVTVVLNKPIGYICSREGQGAPTVYSLLPDEYAKLKIAGRLDKDSSGLVLLTSDGDLVQEISHPSGGGFKVYNVRIHKLLAQADRERIAKGVSIGDKRLSKMQLNGSGKNWQVTLQEGRNRQIRRTFSALGYEVQMLHRTQLGGYNLSTLEDGSYRLI